MLRCLTRFVAEAMDFVYPPQCLICSAGERTPETPHLCSACLAALHAEAPPPAIGFAAQIAPAPAGPPGLAAARGLVAYVDECHAAWPFSEKMQQVVHAMKYDGKRSLARLLARGMATRLVRDKDAMRGNTVIVPVPMHRRRQRERGYNHSALLAGELARLWHLPLEARALRRVRDTLQQALLPAADRPRNVDGAFAVKPPNAFGDLSILLVDDIVTTGSTANSCARVLKDAGAVCVCVMAVARA